MIGNDRFKRFSPLSGAFGVRGSRRHASDRRDVDPERRQFCSAITSLETITERAQIAGRRRNVVLYAREAMVN
jgi:hypothetical protein